MMEATKSTTPKEHSIKFMAIEEVTPIDLEKINGLIDSGKIGIAIGGFEDANKFTLTQVSLVAKPN